MKELTQELVQSLFDYKDGKLYWKVSLNCSIKIGSRTGTLNNKGYYITKINNKNYLTHRLIFLYHYGYLPKYIDHIDNNKINNHIENLREVTLSQNMMNSKPNKNSSSIYKGINWNKPNNKWRARIQINDKRIHFGYFKSEINAAIAYNDMAIKHYGKYAKLNNIEGN